MLRFCGWFVFIVLVLSAVTGVGAGFFLQLGGVFALGALGFWATIAISSLLILGLLDNTDWPSDSTLTILLTLGIFQVTSNFQPFTLAYHNPLWAAGFVGGYLILGLLWSIFKWQIFLGEASERYESVKQRFLESRGLPITYELRKGQNRIVIPQDKKVQWTDYYNDYHRSDSLIPVARDNKSRIIAWMCYWPWSAISFLLRDWIRKLFNQIYENVSRIFEKMQERIFASTKEDFATAADRDALRETAAQRRNRESA